MSMRYRMKQLWWAITAMPLSSAHRNRVDSILNPAEIALFYTFTQNDQAHTMRMIDLLDAAGHHQPDLLTAALLHDIGKTAVNLTIIDRCVVVLGSIFLPGQARKWGGAGQFVEMGAADNWRRPFIVKQHHAAWGAEMVTHCGTSPRALTLIYRHQDHIPDDDLSEEATLLRILQWADDQS